jgi:DUF2889 family protein
MMEVPLLRGRDRHERVIDAWIDSRHADAFTHTVRLSDPAATIEVAAVALGSPSYEIREARGRLITGAVDTTVLDGLPKLAGVGLVGGLGRRVAEATGPGAGAALARDAVIEVARLARQVSRMPREVAERGVAAGALACWELDTTGWIDLPDSCFTYSPAGRALFGARPVSTSMQPDLYSPRPGQERLFTRKKVARITGTADRLVLFHSMYDNVHGFELTYEVDPDTGRIVRAESITPRLPYMGVCSEPQRKIAALVGETLDDGLARRIQTHLGGSSGCAQLYDLTADLLKLLAGR